MRDNGTVIDVDAILASESSYIVRRDAADTKDLKEFNCPLCTYGFAWVLEEPSDRALYEWEQSSRNKILRQHLESHR